MKDQVRESQLLKRKMADGTFTAICLHISHKFRMPLPDWPTLSMQIFRGWLWVHRWAQVYLPRTQHGHWAWKWQLCRSETRNDICTALRQAQATAMCLSTCIQAVITSSVWLKSLWVPPRRSRRYLSILHRAALTGCVSLPGSLQSSWWARDQGVLLEEAPIGSGTIYRNNPPVFLSLSHLYCRCLLVSVVCCSVVLAYSNKCAPEAYDAAALLKINCLL